jgi:tRNA-dihydrouridine synthase B
MTTEAKVISEERNRSNSFADENPQLHIGGRIIPSRYFLAPLAGYTQLAFRIAVRELGGLGLATTDLVLATHVYSKKIKYLWQIETSPADQPLTVQIYSGQVHELVKAARRLEDLGYEGIDINMGCPMPKINSQGGGARLMCDAEKACHTVQQVVEAVDVPVTVKMRLGWDRDSLTAPFLAREFEKIGVKGITIHGRSRQQGFHGSVDLDGIRQTVEAVESIPVIGNGDIRTVKDAFGMRERTGCAAVAIGRGAMLDPWIFRKIQQAVETVSRETSLNAQPSTLNYDEPSPDEQIDFLVHHFTLMIRQHEEYSCTKFRKFAAWYGVRLGIPEDLEKRLQRFESFDEFDEIVEQIRKRHGERNSTVPTALIKVPNGPVERW